MRLLLDTHAWIWLVEDHPRLNPKTKALVERHSGTLWLSPVSVWEAMHIAKRGDVRIKGTPSAWVKSLLAATPAKEAPLTHEIAILSRSIDLGYQDPGDHFIVATAKHMGLKLVTHDQGILAAEACEVIEA